MANRTLVTYGKYFTDFYSSLEENVQEKIDYVFELIKSLQLIPRRFFKHLEGTEGLYEIRVEAAGNIFRIFCFFDEGALVVLINSFQKKSGKTPKQELDLARKLKKQYFIDKEIDNKNGEQQKVNK